ncbi:MAG: hypothetical protein EAZ97_08140 [Bacteroidetes bacterium]|nr:MAG: hypothetical protein EAZ97_08140 [Bacteroidota bacterium]
MVKIVAYHGTATKNEQSIIENGFSLSTGTENEGWLGDGVYFFCEGVPPEPFVSAKKWAIVEAWDNKNYVYKYSDYSILEAIISVEPNYFLDLTTKDGLEIFNYLRDKYVENTRKAKRKLISGDYKDGHIINDAVENEISPDFKVVRGNFYIKLTKEERIYNLQFRTPNCTILAVRDANCIKDIAIFEQGNINKII